MTAFGGTNFHVTGLPHRSTSTGGTPYCKCTRTNTSVRISFVELPLVFRSDFSTVQGIAGPQHEICRWQPNAPRRYEYLRGVRVRQSAGSISQKDGADVVHLNRLRAVPKSTPGKYWLVVDKNCGINGVRCTLTYVTDWGTPTHMHSCAPRLIIYPPGVREA